MNFAHVDDVTLAEHAEGLLEPAQARRVTAHLGVCLQCRSSSAELSEVTSILAEAPRTLPTPDAVAARVDAAIEREVDDRMAAEVQTKRRRFGWLPKTLLAAGAVAAAGVVGSTVLDNDVGDDSTTAAESAGEGGADDAQQEFAQPDTATRPDDPREAPMVAPRVDSARLAEEVRAVVEQRAADGRSGCGQLLADDLNRGLIGSTETDLARPGSVLVVVGGSDENTAQGWVLPDCDARPADAFAQASVSLD